LVLSNNEPYLFPPNNFLLLLGGGVSGGGVSGGGVYGEVSPDTEGS